MQWCKDRVGNGNSNSNDNDRARKRCDTASLVGSAGR
jgi:hypothetical protein